MPLHQQHCSENSSSKIPPLLNQEQCNHYLKEVPEWLYTKDHNEISRKFTFKNYYQCLAFVNAVAWIAHQEDHHPKIEFSYNYCYVIYSTHSAGGVTLFDFICAARIDQLLNNTQYT